MTREQIYTKQLQELGVYEDAFIPIIKDLSEAERQRQRAYKEWRAEAKKERGPKASPSFTSDLWPVICDLDKKILTYRESMGLTPKSLRRLRGATGIKEPEESGIGSKLDALLKQAESYDDPGERET